MRPPVTSKHRPLAALSFLSRSYCCADLSLACHASLLRTPRLSFGPHGALVKKWGLAPAVPCKTKEISLLGRCLSPFFYNLRAQVGCEAKPGQGSAFSLMAFLSTPSAARNGAVVGEEPWAPPEHGLRGLWSSAWLPISIPTHGSLARAATIPRLTPLQLSSAWRAVISKDFLHVCLPWRPHVGMLLSAELLRTPGCSAARVVARVTAAEQQEQFGWLVHCVLVTPMREDEMHEWLSTPPE
jgi:hypothetical protein